MKIGVLKEIKDTRVAIVPEVATKFTKAGHHILVESGAGKTAFFPDEQYKEAGAEIDSRDIILSKIDLLVSIHPPSLDDLQKIKDSTIVLAMFNPRADQDLVANLQQLPILPFSLDSIPRSTIAQSMDILSSMASLAGYKAVLMAANALPGYFPMLMTAAGTIPPAKVLILGAGVAGLQAIATAKRLGATVEAFDVRSAVKEEVQSLGAKFIEVEGAKEDAASGGYAVTQTEEYQRKQKQLIHERASRADVIISTANIPGRRAPVLIEENTVKEMKAGSVIIDLAAATGGNCVLTQNDQVITEYGVKIIGDSNLPAKMPLHASKLFSNNVWNFFQYVFKEGPEGVDYENEIVKSTFLKKTQHTVNT